MRRNVQRQRTETRSIRSSVQILLTVSGIVFLLAGLVLAASGASVSSAVGSVTDRFDDSQQPADDDIESSADSAADAGSGNETDETSGENDESGDGTAADGGGDNGGSDGSTDSGDGETDGDRSDGNTDDSGTDGGSDGTSGDGDDGPHTVTVTVEDRAGNAIAGANVSHNGTVGAGRTTDENGEVAWKVENGTYTVSANADGYLSAEDSVDIDGGNASLTLTLEAERDESGTDDSSDDGSTVTFAVEDGSGEPLDNATVALEREPLSLQGKERKTVDRNGEVDFEREDGEYTFTVIGDGTESDERTVDVDGDTRRRVTVATTDG
ncbi:MULTISPECIES: carboxypeptidase-like regulatory domain-containing protein [unclassified Natrinema]|uniref:carboxypeptidase-like regulatory domain-containing protein n=1 Tax=unclassified Natrinema TaxID=2622230 RepID=UPI000677EF8B|nr:MULTISPECIES: carboxypeptidase-like regulatory domain-containing protein [unclassified Natrinema]